MEALWLIPSDSRKILVEQRGRGRNELIADYLQLKLNAHRTRKQVSSHLQVLKKLLAKDEEFLDIVGPRRSDETKLDASKQRLGRTQPDTTVTSIEQLIKNLREAKLGEPKPAFLLQAEANLEESRHQQSKLPASPAQAYPHAEYALAGSRVANMGSNSMGSTSMSNMGSTSMSNMGSTSMGSTSMGSTSMSNMGSTSNMPNMGNTSSMSNTSSTSNMGSSRNMSRMNSTHNISSTMNSTPMDSHSMSNMSSTPMDSHNISTINSTPLGTPSVFRDSPVYNTQGFAPDYAFHKPQRYALPPDVLQKDPPLMHPRPVHAQDVDVRSREYYIPPSASVPPQELSVADTASPRRTHHHRRTTSRSVDFGGDALLPIQFVMTRRVSDDSHSAVTYTRLIRAAYSSPLNPLRLDSLLGHFPELAKMHAAGRLAGVPIVHATASLFLKPAKGAYASDVQYAMACDQPNPLQHRYVVRTVITSRNKELLRCEMPCMFQALAGRPFEQDKELINVPFLADFWADFLARLNNNTPEYTQAALLALHMFQAVYRVGADGETLCFIGLYQFNSVPDEFSARTRFRKVSSPAFPADSGSPRAKAEPYVPLGAKQDDVPEEKARREPATPTRSGTGATLGEQTPRPISTPMLLGTPSQSLGLGSLMSYESPAIFASPRRINHLDHLDLSGLPFSSTLNSESRGSPRSNKFEIQRAMSAFEPSAWDEMQDWIYK